MGAAARTTRSLSRSLPSAKTPQRASSFCAAIGTRLSVAMAAVRTRLGGVHTAGAEIAPARPRMFANEPFVLQLSASMLATAHVELPGTPPLFHADFLGVEDDAVQRGAQPTRRFADAEILPTRVDGRALFRAVHELVDSLGTQHARGHGGDAGGGRLLGQLG